jgi:hypothetical protein
MAFLFLFVRNTTQKYNCICDAGNIMKQTKNPAFGATAGEQC